ncbi:MAG: isochorismatase family protein [Actinomycetota bacterium]
MSSPGDRSKTALLVIDVQTAVVEHAHERDAVIANINALIDRARAAEAPVVWVQHADDDLPTGAPGWEMASELVPDSDEPIVHKQFRSSFEQTELDDVLTSLDVGRLVVTGAQTDYCVRWTLHGALDHGYDTVLVTDAHTTDDPPNSTTPLAAQLIAHTNAVWATQAVTRCETATAATSEISFA